MGLLLLLLGDGGVSPARQQSPDSFGQALKSCKLWVTTQRDEWRRAARRTAAARSWGGRPQGAGAGVEAEAEWRYSIPEQGVLSPGRPGQVAAIDRLCLSPARACWKKISQGVPGLADVTAEGERRRRWIRGTVGAMGEAATTREDQPATKCQAETATTTVLCGGKHVPAISSTAAGED